MSNNLCISRGERQVEVMYMQQMGDRIALNIVSVLFAMQQGTGSNVTVVGMLLAFIISCLGMYLKKKEWLLLIIACYLLLSLVSPAFVLFYPVLFYEVISVWQDGKYYCYVMVAVVCIIVRLGLCFNHFQVFVLLGEVCGIALAVWLCWNRCRMERMQKQYFKIQDTSAEKTRELKKENRYLLEKQDNDIYTATLQERNRIAREIHDNVGHMLSRGILMTGAMLTIVEDDTIRVGLLDLRECLDEAMTNIRQSVHNLYDDSIDLKQAIENVFQDLSGFQVNFEYDMSETVPREIKYCLLAIVKEAVSNSIRHSRGDRMWIVVQEHPVFYKMSVEDNGHGNKGEQRGGIGLYNIRERVEQQSGTLRVQSGRTGFQIYVTIPKKDGDGEIQKGGLR